MASFKEIYFQIEFKTTPYNLKTLHLYSTGLRNLIVFDDQGVHDYFMTI
jgi:hypothetical protein